MIEVPCPQCGRFPPSPSQGTPSGSERLRRASPPPPCSCPPLPPGPPDPPAERKVYPEILKLRREKRGGGREIVIVEGFNPGTQVDLEALAREIKSACGSGGTVKGRTLEIQGDHRDVIAQVLLAHGFRSKRAGG